MHWYLVAGYACTVARHGAAQFIEDIREGVFIQHTMESMLFDPAGKQLMAEAVYLYGVMLTLMDCKIDGAVRERILVAYYRVKVRPSQRSQLISTRAWCR